MQLLQFFQKKNNERQPSGGALLNQCSKNNPRNFLILRTFKFFSEHLSKRIDGQFQTLRIDFLLSWRKTNRCFLSAKDIF